MTSSCAEAVTPFDSFSIKKPVNQLRLPEDQELLANPLYYRLWGRFQQVPVPERRDPTARHFFRQILGYDYSFDSKLEVRRKNALAQYLQALAESGDYKLSTFVVRKTLSALPCQHWLAGGSVKPQLKSTVGKRLRTTEGAVLTLSANDVILVRENREDDPMHVDIQVLEKDDKGDQISADNQTVASVSLNTWERSIRPWLRAGK